MPDMKSVAFLFMHLLVLFAKSLKSGGAKAVIAENGMADVNVEVDDAEHTS